MAIAGSCNRAFIWLKASLADAHQAGIEAKHANYVDESGLAHRHAVRNYEHAAKSFRANCKITKR